MWQIISLYISSLIVFGPFHLKKNAHSATVQGLNILAQVNLAKILNFTDDFRGDLWNLDDIWGWTLVNLQNTELFGLFWYWRTLLRFSPYSVLLVITLTYVSYLFGQTLSHRTISHYPWHICWLTSTFVPHFTLQTLCPAYLNNPQFLYKYWTQSLVHSNLFLPVQ